MRTAPRDLALARQLTALTEEMMWNLSEQYVSDGGTQPAVLKAGNEIVSLYIRPTAAEADAIAEQLESIIGPMRRAKVLALLDRIDGLTGQIRALQVAA